MKLPLYQIDAFARLPFSGNPAAVCPLQKWLPDTLLQQIAAENNLSETAFFVPTEQRYHIRWFTPTTEVRLCGHATLASAHVLFELLGHHGEQILFDSASGRLTVTRSHGGRLEMDFPAAPPRPCPAPAALGAAFTIRPLACLRADDYIVVLADEAAVRTARPDLQALRSLDGRGVAITARGQEYDFVSRFFAPNQGIDEDPVTGSSFTELAPYWAAELGKRDFHACQVSARGGEVWCHYDAARERVAIAGHAVCYLRGSILVPG